jgi:hypothetical protein
VHVPDVAECSGARERDRGIERAAGRGVRRRRKEEGSSNVLLIGWDVYSNHAMTEVDAGRDRATRQRLDMMTTSRRGRWT